MSSSSDDFSLDDFAQRVKSNYDQRKAKLEEEKKDQEQFAEQHRRQTERAREAAQKLASDVLGPVADAFAGAIPGAKFEFITAAESPRLRPEIRCTLPAQGDRGMERSVVTTLSASPREGIKVLVALEPDVPHRDSNDSRIVRLDDVDSTGVRRWYGDALDATLDLHMGFPDGVPV